MLPFMLRVQAELALYVSTVYLSQYYVHMAFYCRPGRL